MRCAAFAANAGACIGRCPVLASWTPTDRSASVTRLFIASRERNHMNQRHARQRLLLVCSLLSLLVVTGCASGPTIRSNVDSSVDFSSFRTFGFISPLSTDREGYQSLISQQLVTSAERELVARGLQRTDTNPDLLVNFSANLDQRLRVTQTPAIHGRSFNSHRRGLYSTWPLYQQTEIQQYTKGTLGVDVVDAARRQLVWEGFALGRVTQRTTDNLGPVLDSAVVDIFSRFPLQPK
jgi:hypothetical protein